ncbi:mycofactocin biosynthesis chaperone MftB [Leifsonia sp. TF02-11]|nr:mycofactocin biosynthesis chaperone MftB [Leifsonia sp. TF02-11]
MQCLNRTTPPVTSSKPTPSSRRFRSTGCAVSTKAHAEVIDLERSWRLHPQVSVRPEPFGALLYHFGTRKLSFLKDRRLLAVVEALPTQDTARDACLASGVAEGELPRFGQALDALRRSEMLVEAAS